MCTLFVMKKCEIWREKKFTFKVKKWYLKIEVVLVVVFELCGWFGVQIVKITLYDFENFMTIHDLPNVKNTSGQTVINYLEKFMKFVLEIAIFMFKQL